MCPRYSTPASAGVGFIARSAACSCFFSAADVPASSCIGLTPSASASPSLYSLSCSTAVPTLTTSGIAGFPALEAAARFAGAAAFGASFTTMSCLMPLDDLLFLPPCPPMTCACDLRRCSRTAQTRASTSCGRPSGPAGSRVKQDGLHDVAPSNAPSQARRSNS
eukprot:7383025-Prymnesium_polylepis.1